MEDDKFVRVEMSDVKIEKGMGNLYACGHKTGNLWYKVISVEESHRGRVFVCLVPPGASGLYFNVIKKYPKRGQKHKPTEDN